VELEDFTELHSHFHHFLAHHVW